MLLADGKTQFIYGPKGRPLEQVSSSGGVLWFHQDQLGSTRALTNPQGKQGDVQLQRLRRAAGIRPREQSSLHSRRCCMRGNTRTRSPGCNTFGSVITIHRRDNF